MVLRARNTLSAEITLANCFAPFWKGNCPRRQQTIFLSSRPPLLKRGLLLEAANCFLIETTPFSEENWMQKNRKAQKLSTLSEMAKTYQEYCPL